MNNENIGSNTFGLYLETVFSYNKGPKHFDLMNKNVFFENCRKVKTVSSLYDYNIFVSEMFCIPFQSSPLSAYFCATSREFHCTRLPNLTTKLDM
jgi:hypothetical protein